MRLSPTAIRFLGPRGKAVSVPMQCRRSLSIPNSHALSPAPFRSFASSPLRPMAPPSSAVVPSYDPSVVRIVEVGPRDGLQNEKSVIPVEVKVELINRLAEAGMKTIEAGSFVSPKWVPQMAGTADIIAKIIPHRHVSYPVLVPNQRGLENLFSLLSSPNPPPIQEIAIFTAATSSFTLANTNVNLPQSLSLLRPLASLALERGLRVRGYVSCVIECPYEGPVEPRRVREVVKELVGMGCYEISLGDTTGQGTPEGVKALIEEVKKEVPVEMLAGHFHDTYGTALSNIHTAMSLGVRTFDSSIAGLGGCPYSPGATGNVATEDVVYSLLGSGHNLDLVGNGDGRAVLERLVETGWWISDKLGRANASRAGRAIKARRERAERLERERKEKELKESERVEAKL